ncbi:MAG: hypothetical protein U9P42_08190 [Candidatus Fermentibacteria bacterium]|nr:hypothetical protein [Candidatus Fermentibacteria bacterium]
MRTILISAMVMLGLAGCIGQGNRILVRNDSDRIYNSVTVSVCDSTWVIQTLAPGEEEEFTIVYTSDDSFHISAETTDEQIVEGNFGYVTHGISDDTIEIIFCGDSICFDQKTNNLY